ncbi:hypothetical protein [Sphingobium sp. KCTC 72723]|uniref:hypothetical protein n=1 Tax=Sphingobium sp. KCTC 72723 TaxID=2733867 RepID=UPI00165D7FEC|nr:hypothetical protein [Sphingobium sp. KCTC 72723]
MRALTILLLPILLSACSGDDPPQRKDARDTPPATDLATARETVPDVSPAPEPIKIPVLLQGHWAGLNEQCDDRRAVLELTILPDQLVFHESVGTVQSVTGQADGTFAVKAAFTGEGQSWTRTLSMDATDDGQRLTIVHDAVAITRKRC